MFPFQMQFIRETFHFQKPAHEKTRFAIILFTEYFHPHNTSAFPTQALKPCTLKPRKHFRPPNTLTQNIRYQRFGEAIAMRLLFHAYLPPVREYSGDYLR